MELTFLGTGTSTGVPQIGCTCPTCTSVDPCDKRMRCSAMVTIGGKNILIDCGPDFRQQMLDAKISALDALLLTHIHYDHVGGIDDLRPFCLNGRDFPIYCRADVDADLRARLPYCFYEHKYPGVPTFDMHIIRENEAFDIDGINVMPLPVMHASLPILGFRIGQLGYITDCKTMPESTIDALHGIHTLVINALRPNRHMSHLCLSEALELTERIAPKQAFFTHMSHHMPPQADVTLPPGVALAHDMLKITVPE